MDGEPQIVADVRRRHCDHFTSASAPPKLVARGPASGFTQTVSLWVKISVNERSRGEEKRKPVLQCLLSWACFVTGTTIAGAKTVLHNGKLTVRGSGIACRNVHLVPSFQGCVLPIPVRSHSSHGYSANPQRVSKGDVLRNIVSCC